MNRAILFHESLAENFHNEICLIYCKLDEDLMSKCAFIDYFHKRVQIEL